MAKVWVARIALTSEGHPSVAHGCYSLGTTRQALGDAQGAEGAFDQAITMHESLFRGDHVGAAVSYARRASACATQTGKADGARKDVDAALALLRRLPEACTALSAVLAQSAQQRLDVRDARGALKELEELVPLAESVHDADSPRPAEYRAASAKCRQTVATEAR